MAYARKQWLDHVVQFPNRYRETSEGGNLVTEIPAPGDIIQQGTPQSAANFNNLEEGVVQANEMSDYALVLAGMLIRRTDALRGFSGDVTLTNNMDFPFNQTATGETTVSLPVNRDTVDYTVDIEVTKETGGCAGQVTVFDKQKNGFKLRFDGSAKSIVVHYTVRGGGF